MGHIIQIVLQIGIGLSDTIGAKTKDANIRLVIHYLLLEISHSKIRLCIGKSAVQDTNLLKIMLPEQFLQFIGIRILSGAILLQVTQIIFGVGITITDNGHGLFFRKHLHSHSSVHYSANCSCSLAAIAA